MPVKDWLPAAVRLAAIDRKLKAGEPLFHLGDKTSGLYEVIAGRVRLTRVDRSGRETVLYIAGPGETIAEASLFSPVYHCDAVAGSDAVVRLYPKPAVLVSLRQGPQGGAGLLRHAGAPGHEPAHPPGATRHPLRARAGAALFSRSIPAPTAAPSNCAAPSRISPLSSASRTRRFTARWPRSSAPARSGGARARSRCAGDESAI